MSRLELITNQSDAHIDQGVVVDSVTWPGIDANPPLGCVLTARCDFAQSKATWIKCVALKPAAEVLLGLDVLKAKVETADEGKALSKTKWKELSAELTKYVMHKTVSRYYFLTSPNPDEMPHAVLDFQQVTSFLFNEVENCPKVMRIPSPHPEHMISFYAAYSGRIGLADVSSGESSKVVEQLLSPYHEKQP